jgi:hypothetical protein
MKIYYKQEIINFLQVFLFVSLVKVGLQVLGTPLSQEASNKISYFLYLGSILYGQHKQRIFAFFSFAWLKDFYHDFKIGRYEKELMSLQRFWYQFTSFWLMVLLVPLVYCLVAGCMVPDAKLFVLVMVCISVLSSLLLIYWQGVV